MVAAAPVARPESGSVEAEETWNTASDALNAAEESCQVLEQKYLPDLPGQTPAPPQSPPPDAEGNATDRDTEEGGNEIYLLQRAFLDAPLPVEESGSLTSDSKSSSKLLGLAGVNPESERESGTLDREPSPAKKADPHELAAAVNADRAGRRKSLFGDWLQGAKQRRQSVKSVKSSADGTPKQPETRRKSMFWGVDQGLNFFSRGNTLAGQDGADGGKRRNSGEATDSGATGRFVHKDVQAHLLQLQEMSLDILVHKPASGTRVGRLARIPALASVGPILPRQGIPSREEVQALIHAPKHALAPSFGLLRCPVRGALDALHTLPSLLRSLEPIPK
mmetsp:Transcript_30140/g.70316  ORF Transcript_30140/g.70316 Transcript_30140/m.70316 type:complete len:335 (-) Transcript_30140:568-1572(-)